MTIKRIPNTRIISKLILSTFVVLFCLACNSKEVKNKSNYPFITSSEPIRIVSINDGSSIQSQWGGSTKFPNSVTVIDLLPDQPPLVKTVEDAAPNTFAGAPYGATTSNGSYAFISDHPFGTTNDTSSKSSLISVIDLDSETLSTLKTFQLPHHAWQVMSHPDDKRIVAISDHQFHLFQMNGNQPELIYQSESFSSYFTSFAISPNGTSIIATAAERLDYSTPVSLQLFDLIDNSINHVTEIEIEQGIGKIDQPFAPRFSPDGQRILVLNGLGIAAKPPLDDVLSIDMKSKPPKVTEVIKNVAQGLESLAYHPSGRFAVVTCIDGPYIGHLAVIDLTSSPMRILNYIPVEFVPQGIEFSPNGKMLFVQSTTASHISVYEVDGFHLNKMPYVLKTGEGPASMAISLRR